MTQGAHNNHATFLPARFTATIAALIWVCAPAQIHGQPAGCSLIPDSTNPAEKILRCGESLTIRAAPDTRYGLSGQDRQQQPTGAQIESGALLIEFTPSERRRQFQILTPHAIAAVRGTKWAVEVAGDRSSTLVLAGTVEVRRLRQRRGPLLRAGEGADVSPGTSAIVVKTWAPERVDALLARFK